MALKASEVIKYLQLLIDKHGDLETVYSADDEGNDFNDIYFKPSAGVYADREFNAPRDGEKPNRICIN